MAAFDVTTRPTSLSLKPGSTTSILVVVSNRLGRPVMGLVEGTLSPPSTGRWLVSPPDLQRRFEADPAATVSYEFRIAVPVDAPTQAVQFKASVRDVLSPDDTRAEGQTVAINVTRDSPPPSGKKKLPWWIWLIAGLVIVGAGIGIYLICCANKAKVPNVVGMTEGMAKDTLTKAGFDSIAVQDTTVDESRDTNKVVRQEPTAAAKMPKAKTDEKLVVTIVVNRLAGRVPLVVGKTELEAKAALEGAGFAPITPRDSLVRQSPVAVDRVLRQEPPADSPVPPENMRGQTPATIWIRRAASIVPNLEGISIKNARAALDAAGLRLGNVSIRSTAVMSKHGTIVGSAPDPGTLVPKGLEVHLKVYSFGGLPIGM